MAGANRGVGIFAECENLATSVGDRHVQFLRSTLDDALCMLEVTDGCEYALVPAKPSEDMMRIGATLDGISLAQARAIYRAMLWAA